VKITLQSKKRGAQFNRQMERFCEQLEHLGLMAGGSWNSRTGEATLFPYAHSECSVRCSLPRIKRITPKIRQETEKMIARYAFETWEVRR
jgi:hypothetical protein